MHKENGACTRGEFSSRLSLTYTSMAANADQWKWCQIPTVFPLCPFNPAWHEDFLNFSTLTLIFVYCYIKRKVMRNSDWSNTIGIQIINSHIVPHVQPCGLTAHPIGRYQEFKFSNFGVHDAIAHLHSRYLADTTMHNFLCKVLYILVHQIVSHVFVSYRTVSYLSYRVV